MLKKGKQVPDGDVDNFLFHKIHLSEKEEADTDVQDTTSLFKYVAFFNSN